MRVRRNVHTFGLTRCKSLLIMQKGKFLEKGIAIITLFVLLGRARGSTPDNCILLGSDEVKIKWNFGDDHYQILINDSQVETANLIANQQLCFESGVGFESEITFIIKFSKIFNLIEPPNDSENCDKPIAKLDVIKINNFRSNETDKKRSKKSLSNQKVRKRKRGRTLTSGEIRLAKRFFKKLKQLDRKHKGYSKRKAKSKRTLSYKRKYSKIEGWVKRKHPRSKSKVQKRFAHGEHNQEETQTVVSPFTTEIPHHHPKLINITKPSTTSKDCNISQYICPNLSDKLEASFSINTSDLLNCFLSRPARTRYYISLFQTTHMSNFTVILNPRSRSTKSKDISTKTLSTPSEKKPSDELSASHGLHYTAILVIISTTFFLLTIVLIAFCVHTLKIKQKRMNRHKNDCCHGQEEFENICQRCPLNCDQSYNVNSRLDMNRVEGDAGTTTACKHSGNPITRDRRQCSNCKLKQAESRQQHSSLWERHKNVEDYHMREQNHMTLPVAMQTYRTDSGRQTVHDQSTNSYKAQKPPYAMRHFQFPDGEEHNNPELQKLFEGSLMTPDSLNMSCNKYRPPPNRTLFQSEAFPPSGSTDANRSSNTRHNKFFSSKETSRNIFAQSRKKPKKNDEGKITQACRCIDHSNPDFMTNNNSGAFNSEAPPLYSEVIHEGHTRSSAINNDRK